MPIRPDGPSFGDHSWWANGRPIVVLIMFAILIGVLVWGVLRLSSSSTSGPAPVADGGRHDGALEELRVRYARGEMTREEFVQRFRDLGGTGIDPTPPAA
ncbi:MAG TPA: SHOCT domain-containing protein [Actinomycetota bacterium]